MSSSERSTRYVARFAKSGEACRPEPDMGSAGGTLGRRIPDLDRDRIKQAMRRLHSKDLIVDEDFGAMMTGLGAEDLRIRLTLDGSVFTRFRSNG